jgi:hypothetical protein
MTEKVGAFCALAFGGMRQLVTKEVHKAASRRLPSAVIASFCISSRTYIVGSRTMELWTPPIVTMTG